MRNKYAGTCYRCRERVEVGQGHFERYKGGWRTQHADCCRAAQRVVGEDNSPEAIAERVAACVRDRKRYQKHFYEAKRHTITTGLLPVAPLISAPSGENISRLENAMGYAED